MSRARMAVLHAGLVRRAAAAPAPEVYRDLLPVPGQMPAEPPLQPLAWSPPTVVPFRPPEPAAVPAPRPRRKAMTLRLEPVRHQRLKAACAELGRSCQSVLVEALESWLAERERRSGV